METAADADQIAVGSSSSDVSPDAPATPQILAQYGNLPLRFEENVGQADAAFDFVARSQSYVVYLSPSKLLLRLASQPREVEIALVGAGGHALMDEQNRLITKSNYFVGRNPAAWRTGISNFSKARFSGVYPGINLVYYGTEGQIEHDFIVQPGADPSMIKLQVTGADEVKLGGEGDVHIRIENEELLLKKPILYQEVGNEMKVVDGRYSLLKNGQIAFKTGPYDESKPLVIDPVIGYSTYLGGRHHDDVTGSGFPGEGDLFKYGVAVDPNGNAVVAGSTLSTDFPVENPIQTDNGDLRLDAFVAMLNADGSQLIFSTYLVGNAGDAATDVALDADGNVYVAGWSWSNDFPMVSPIKATHSGVDFDAIVFKLGPDGSTLLFSTYLGGTQPTSIANDKAFAIAVAGNGVVCATGITISADFPLVNSVDPQRVPGEGDIFLSKIDTLQSQLEYSGRFGGSGAGLGFDVVVDPAGNIYLTGLSGAATDFPATPGAFQPVAVAAWNPFVAKFAPSGTLVYSTYVTGSGLGFGTGIALGLNGNAYVTGVTMATDFPLRNPLFADRNESMADAFAFELNSGGTDLVWSTYLGGTNGESSGHGIALDAAGNIYVSGWTTATDFPTLSQIQVDSDGILRDAYVAKIQPGGTQLSFSSYLGGTYNDRGLGIAVDPAGGVYVFGGTESTDFPTTSGVFQPQSSVSERGYLDLFITKLGPLPDGNGGGEENRAPVAEAGADGSSECSSALGGLVSLDGSASTDPDSAPGTNDDIVTFEWFEGTTLIASGETPSATLPLGTHSITLKVTDSGGLSDTDDVVVTVQDTTAPTLSVSVSPASLWPPNHKMVEIVPAFTASDACDPNPSVVVLSAVSNEPDNGLGDGDTEGDIQITGGQLFLRAERSGTGTGRIYTITFQAADSSGNSTTSTATVTVPHDQGQGQSQPQGQGQGKGKGGTP